MSSKSGLGDSPLFVNPTPIFEASPPSIALPQVPMREPSPTVSDSPNKTPSAKSKNAAGRSPGQLNERSVEQVNARSAGQAVSRSDGQGYRPIVRHTYDFYLDQIHAIEDEVVRRSRQRGRAVTKGEVVREIVDFYFAKRKK